MVLRQWLEKKNEEQNARPGAIRRLQRDEKKKKEREKKRRNGDRRDVDGGKMSLDGNKETLSERISQKQRLCLAIV